MWQLFTLLGCIFLHTMRHLLLLLAAITATEENEKYIGGSFNATVTDADYDNVRKMFENVGVTEFTQFVGE